MVKKGVSNMEENAVKSTAEFYKPKEVSSLLNCSLNTVYSIIKLGQIPCIRLGERLYRIPKKEFWEWIGKNPQLNVSISGKEGNEQ